MSVYKYKKMYCKLFKEVAKAINLLQQAQINTEEIFISDSETTVQFTNASEKTEP